MKKFIARATVFFNEDFYWIHTQATGMVAYADPSVEPFNLPPNVSNRELGETVRLALKGSRQVELKEFQALFNGGAIKASFNARKELIMKNYGYKTKSSMYKKMDNCFIEYADGVIEIQPTHQNSIDGYSVSQDGPFPLSVADTCSDEELGKAVREAFKRCTSVYPRQMP